jgi:hypothetical protein
MRLLTFILFAVQLCTTLAAGQNSDCASVSQSNKEVILTANSWDPVYAIGATLADRYGINISVESPQWAFPGDTEDVAIADPQFSAQHRNAHYLIMKRHTVEVGFSPVGNPAPNDVSHLLSQVAEAANKEMPYFYRLDAHDDEYVLVPTKIRSSSCEVEDAQPLLDRRVTIPPASRSIAEHARIMADQLSEQTGLNISCCQMLASGVNWGLAEVPFSGRERARSRRSAETHSVGAAGKLSSAKPTPRLRSLGSPLRRDRRTVVLHRSRRKARASVPLITLRQKCRRAT